MEDHLENISFFFPMNCLILIMVCLNILLLTRTLHKSVLLHRSLKTTQNGRHTNLIEYNVRISLFRFKFAGRLIGHAIAQGYLLDVFFTRPFYKALLNQ